MVTRNSGCLALALCFWVAAANQAMAQPRSLLLKVRNAPAHGLVVARVKLTALLPGTTVRPEVRRFRALLPEGRAVPIQLVADESEADRATPEGTLALRLPRGGDWILRLLPEESAPDSLKEREETIRTGRYALLFSSSHMAGLPSGIYFAKSGRRFENFVWNDRVHDPKLGSFWLRLDPQAKPEVVADGPVCTVVRIRARYCQEGEKRPASQPEAVYDWYLFQDLPLAFVSARIRQQEPFVWSELHFLELNFPGEDFRRYAGGDPPTDGVLTVSQKSTLFNAWGALIDGQDAIGMFGNPITLYDGRGGYGTYLHSTWTTWSDREIRLGTWLWIGSADDPAKAVSLAAQQYLAGGQVVLTRPEIHQRIAALRQRKGTKEARWRAALAERLEAQGDLKEAERAARGALPSGWSLHIAGDFGLALQRTADGVRLQSLFDLGTERELLAPDTPPLFTLLLRDTASKEQKQIAADAGWRQVRVTNSGGALTVRWLSPSDSRLVGLQVTAKAVPDRVRHAWHWSLRVENSGSAWSVWRVAFPQVDVAEPGEGAFVLFPRGPGETKRDVWRRSFSYRGTYPGGWCSMQLMAVYGGGSKPTGLYYAIHDPMGSVKDIVLTGDPASRSVRLIYEHPAPGMGKAGNGFTLGGEAVWQLLRGDWFDAAVIYKEWARRGAKWWPHLTKEGRADTPLWMRELSVWALGGGAPQECVNAVKQFAQYLGVPAGFHWYNWHQIPFDNDYPHYFPTREGVAGGAKELQQAGVYVMPYINGRLWDTRDRGAEDFEFSRVARPSATKDENGQPYIETYGSKEKDDSPVRLAVMCPTTELWQRTVRETVLRLFHEVGVNGVYVDQVAAAAPALCMDPTHKHPPGGGSWWNEGYWRLIGYIRDTKPPDRMLTTECNAEPFLHTFDGYLTWHWQSDGQVPVFPAIYGGAVQMFGRNFGGGPTRDLALRMKVGQQLVFGEQIGWIAPGVVQEKENGEFLRQVVRLRHRFRRCFYAGEMARPPDLVGEMPTVRADWQWYGETWVTTDAVLTGAWKIPGERRLVLFFVNVSDTPVSAVLRFDARRYGVSAARLKVSRVEDPDAPSKTEMLPGRFERKLLFPARRALAWEARW